MWIVGKGACIISAVWFPGLKSSLRGSCDSWWVEVGSGARRGRNRSFKGASAPFPFSETRAEEGGFGSEIAVPLAACSYLPTDFIA